MISCRFIAIAPVALLGCAPEGFPEAVDVPWVAGRACAPSRAIDVGCVLDGDTFDVGRCGGERVRLLGVDAPEVAHERPAECFGESAAVGLSQRLEDSTLWISFDDRCEDDFGRTLGYVWYVDEEGVSGLVNEWLIHEGYARVYRGASAGPLVYQPRLDAAEASAAARGVGWWSACAE